MENIYNNYKTIIERAILAGIITEDSRDFYLSAFEENDSELLEFDNPVMTEESRNSNLNLKQKKGTFHTGLSTIGENNNTNKTTKRRPLKYNDTQFLLSDDSIENYSILDIKSSKEKKIFSEDDSDSSSVKQEKLHLVSLKKLKSSKPLTSVMKKPPKYRLIDFNVPIYLGIRKKRPAVSSHSSHFIDSKRHETLPKNACKSSNLSVQKTEEVKGISGWTLPKAKGPVIKRRKSIPQTNFSFRDQLDQNDCEVSTNTNQETEISQERKSILISPQLAPKADSESYNENPEMILNREVKQDKNSHRCMNQQHNTNGLLRLKFYREQFNQEHVYRVKLKQPIDSDVHQHSHDIKDKSKNKISAKRNAYKCKRCGCNCICKSVAQLSSSPNTETTSGDETSTLNIPMTSNFNERNEGLLNLNIICKFYQDEKVKKRSDIQDFKNATGSQETPEKSKDKAPEEHITGNENKQSQKIHRLSKIFTNMKKINKKLKNPNNH